MKVLKRIKRAALRSAQLKKYLRGSTPLFLDSKPKKFIVRCANINDVLGISALIKEMQQCDLSTVDAGKLFERIENFPQGQWVAVDKVSKKIIGVQFSLMIRWEEYRDSIDWKSLTARGSFANHSFFGADTLFRPLLLVDSNYDFESVAESLDDAFKRLAVKRCLPRVLSTSRLPGFGSKVGNMGLKEYVRDVINGYTKDPSLSFWMRNGYSLVKPLKKFRSNDKASLGSAVLIRWNEGVSGRNRANGFRFMNYAM